MFGTGMFGPRPGFFDDRPAQPQPPMRNNARGLVIEEINSDEEGEEVENGGQRRGNSRKHGRSDKEPLVEGPPTMMMMMNKWKRRTRHMQNWNNYSRQPERSQPQTRSFSFQSSTVTYGGPNGRIIPHRPAGGLETMGCVKFLPFCFVMVEESKEADSTTRKASHRVSRGLHDRVGLGLRFIPLSDRKWSSSP
ncbi:hypothetical protein Sjap_020556 [Stephania japonica]|uniref:Uncharacterized protein n=1 Tax=Stephania japonica TaxID=461633 RepID=A0AAP0HZ39_9MAGN